MIRLRPWNMIGLAVGFTVLLWWLASPGYAHHGTAATASPISGVTYEHVCPGADAACLAITERLEWLHANGDAHDALLTSIESNTAGSGEPAEVAGTVALSAADRERLDLTWWGAWAMVGLLFILIAAPRWFAAFRVTRGA